MPAPQAMTMETIMAAVSRQVSGHGEDCPTPGTASAARSVTMHRLAAACRGSSDIAGHGGRGLTWRGAPRQDDTT